MDCHLNYIAGRWMTPESGTYYQTRNPARPAEVLGEFPCSTEADVDHALAAADSARVIWAGTPAPQRAAILVRFSQLLADSPNELARIITLEPGKALQESNEVARASSKPATWREAIFPPATRGLPVTFLNLYGGGRHYTGSGGCSRCARLTAPTAILCEAHF
jgi:hypothetical protein